MLQRTPLGFRKQEVNDDEQHCKNTAKNDIKLPADGFHRHWIDELADDQPDESRCVRHCNAASTQSIVKDLDWVCQKQGCPGNVVEEIVDEDKGHDGVSCSGVERGCEVCRERRPDDVADKHAGHRCEEQRAAAKSVNHKSACKHGGKPVEDLKQAIDEGLIRGFSDADGIEHEREVV